MRRAPLHPHRGSLDVAPGESAAVVVPFACGKSALLTLVAGLPAPSGGEVRVGGPCRAIG
ncbi:hypothetical protein [Streptomyces wuyuanensis]|uniref:hypothetical protein n=1 Tax=Streptomyces wuyuanensis TaxID=1196353 RepID=UPI003D713BA6